jgi:hemolysin activation/secretion protein
MLAAALLIRPATAQTPPDAGRLRQDIEQKPLPAPARPIPVPPTAPSAPVADDGLRFTVSRFEFSGNTKVDAKVLNAALADLIVRPLNFAELQSATGRIAEAYRRAGWIARAVLPPQDLADASVRIQIIESRFGRLRLEVGAGETARVDLTRLERIISAHLPADEPISTAALDRALMLLDELPGVTAQGRLAAGAGEGETDLVVSHAADRLFSGEVRVDNSGSRSTGSERVSANMSVASPSAGFFGGGDSWGAMLLHTQGSDYGRLAYSRAIRSNGLTVGINVSQMHYRLIGSDFAALRASGSSHSTGLELSFPVLRAREASANLLAALEDKAFDNQSGGVVTTRYGIRSATLTTSGQAQDAWLGGGVLQGSLGVVAGALDLSNSPNRAADAASTRTAGDYHVLRYSLVRQQALNEAWRLNTQWRGQRANKNLDSAEKFYLGGSGGVRAYPGSEAGGADGDLISIELGTRLPGGFDLAVLHDWGRVRVNVDNQITGAATQNQLILRGIGLTLAWAHPSGANARVTWAHRLGNNPNPTAAGRDQDGTLIGDRMWVTAAWNF